MGLNYVEASYLLDLLKEDRDKVEDLEDKDSKGMRDHMIFLDTVEDKLRDAKSRDLG